MLPRLYGSKETNFEHNGIGILIDTVSCLVTEEINGMYELELTYKVGSFLCRLLVEDNIVKAKANDEHEPQLFRIYYVGEEINGTITIKAEHISYDLRGNFLENIMLANVTCQEAGIQMLNNLAEPTNFTFKSDIEHRSNYNISRCNGLEAIKGKKGSLVDTFGNGPKLVRDNFNISLVKNRGKNNNVLISYRKNMTGYKRELDLTNLVTKIYPFALKQVEETSVEELIVLPERFLVSKNYSKYAKGKIASLDYSSEESVKDIVSLRALSEKWFNDTKRDEPDVNYQVEFINLYKTSNYKNLGLEQLEKVCLDDTVIIRDYRFNLNVEARVIKTVYNTLTEKYEKLELGKFRDSLKLNDNDLNDKVDNTIQQVKNMLVRFELLDDKIVSEVSRLDGDIKTHSTLIEQTAEAITQVAKDVEDNTSLINQTANEINLEVSKKVGKDSVISSINMSPENIKIQSKNLDLRGMVTISDLEGNGTVTINGGNIEANTLNGNSIIAGTIEGSDIKSGTIACDMLSTPAGHEPVINLFSDYSRSCQIDARNSDGGNKGSAIRLKYDDSNYLFINSNGISAFIGGSQDFVVNETGVLHKGAYLSKNGHTHNYADSYHTHYVLEDNYNGSARVAVFGGNSAWRFRQHCSVEMYLGDSGNRWGAIYSNTGTIQTSSKKHKKNIEYVDDMQGRKMFKTSTTPFIDFMKDMFRPATYRLIAKNTDADTNEIYNQIGFIAEDVAETDIGKTFVYNVEEDETKEADYMYSTSGYVTVVATALQEEIKKREEEIKLLKEENIKLKETINNIVSRLEKLEKKVMQ